MKNNAICQIMLMTAFLASAAVNAENNNYKPVLLDLENATSFSQGLDVVPGENDSSMLKITAPLAGKLRFKRVAVNDKTKYRLSFKGKLEGVETIEKNPRLEQLIFNQTSYLPSYQLKFLNANNKRINKFASPSIAMPFGQWHDYKWDFYPPLGAAYIQLELNAGKKGNHLSLSNFKLEPVPVDSSASININPAFSDGPYNYSGWYRFGKDRGKLCRINKDKTVFDSGYGISSLTFPFKEPGTYRIYMKCTNYQKPGYREIILNLYDKDGKNISKVRKARRRNLENGQSVYFVLPVGAVRGNFTIYNYVIEELRLTRVGDEATYQELAK